MSAVIISCRRNCLIMTIMVFTIVTCLLFARLVQAACSLIESINLVGSIAQFYTRYALFSDHSQCTTDTECQAIYTKVASLRVPLRR